MIAQLRRLTSAIVLLDNNSTHPLLLRMYDALEGDATVAVVRLKSNHGHDVLKFVYDYLPDIFAYTDPDLQIPTLESRMLDVLAELTNEYRVGKAGVALDISAAANISSSLRRRPPWGQTSMSVVEWEERYWKERLQSTQYPHLIIYKAAVDTTFAVYNKKYFRHDDTRYDAVRVAGTFTAVHLPWIGPNADTSYYQQSKLGVVGEWNHEVVNR
jgi:hypothetical protein